MSLKSEQKILNEAYDTAIEAVVRASQEVYPFWPNPQNKLFNPQLALEVIDKEGSGNYATIADKKSGAKIIEVIQSNPLFKNHSIVTEDSEEILEDKDWKWVIDEIDGTINFRNGNPDFGICVALFNGSRPVMGLIAMPGLKQITAVKDGSDAILYSYERTEIAHLKDLSQRYSDQLSRALVGYDLGYEYRLEQLSSEVAKISSKVGYPSCLGSFSTGNFRLLQGMMGVYFGMRPTLMDIAPAAALVPAIGGIISNMEGKPIDWNASERSYIAAINPKIHNEFLEALYK